MNNNPDASGDRVITRASYYKHVLIEIFYEFSFANTRPAANACTGPQVNRVTVILKDTSMALNVSQTIGNNATIAYTNATSRGRNTLQRSLLKVFYYVNQVCGNNCFIRTIVFKYRYSEAH